MIRRPPRSTLDRSSAASDVYKRQILKGDIDELDEEEFEEENYIVGDEYPIFEEENELSLIHISEPTRPY